VYLLGWSPIQGPIIYSFSYSLERLIPSSDIGSLFCSSACFEDINPKKKFTAPEIMGGRKNRSEKIIERNASYCDRKKKIVAIIKNINNMAQL
jgi:hypothetical protein